MNAHLNASLAAKKAATLAARENGDWGRFIFLHERPWRANAFAQIASGLDDPTYWRLTREVYQDSENVEEQPRLWKPLLKSPRPGREHMMDEGERERLAALPARVIVFRGASGETELMAGFGC